MTIADTNTDTASSTQPSKGQQILTLIGQLRDALQTAAGGTDPQVQEVLSQMEGVLK
jgi:hypothetical protein